MKPLVVTIDGNIGSGKSTIIDKLKQKYFNDKPNINICFLKEPVDTWSSIKDGNDNNILELFYNDKHTYSFSFQMVAYISRLSTLKEALKKNYDIIISERSVFTDRYVFAKMLHKSGFIKEIDYKIYTMWFDEFVSELPDFIKIYILTDPKIAYERIQSRNRSGENNIDYEYIVKCNSEHNKWLWYEANLCLNGDCDSSSESYLSNIEKIYNYILNLE